MSILISQGAITLAGALLLGGVSENVTSVPDPLGHGVFLEARAPQTASRHVFTLAERTPATGWMATWRVDPWMMRPSSGTALGDIPRDTQMLLMQLPGERWAVLVPIYDGAFRFTLRGRDGRLELLAETGDARVYGNGGVGVYLGVGDDPFRLMEDGAKSVAARLKSGKLRRDKPVPDFVDLFGWCTWDAFYQDVSPDKVRSGLESFARGGVKPKLLILDDGWQSTERMPTGEQRLTSLAPNAKFGGDLTPLVQMAKKEFGVERLLVWHAIVGYWGGVSGATLPQYAPVEQPRHWGEEQLAIHPSINHEWWSSLVGLIPASKIDAFYNDYHKSLRAMGVDGVKVDVQAVLEALSQGQGGRVALTRAYRQALESSVQKHFGSRLINCMSHATETWYQSNTSTVIRTSTDFWPKKPETHGLHLWTNAAVSVWFSEFMHPDWDMFQSGHEWGAFHAAGRALSGGPIYVSDKPEQHDFALLRKLVNSDGRALRCDLPGRPTVDALLVDPTRDDALLKVWNRAGAAGLVGVFNGRYWPKAEDRKVLAGTVGAADVPQLAGDTFVAFSHQSQTVQKVDRATRLPVKLGQNQFEVFTFAPVENGFAVVGLADKFASPAAVSSVKRSKDAAVIDVKDGGTLVAFSAVKPARVEANGKAATFTHDAATGALRVTLADSGKQTVSIRW